MNKDNYFDNRKIKVEEKLREVKKLLPKFCNEFFIGIETQTTPLTRLNYAFDLKTFFYYLSSETAIFNNYNIYDFTLNDLQKVDTGDIEAFISYLSYYKVNDKVYTNAIESKARKLATVRSLFKYFFNKNKLECDVASKVLMPKKHEKPIIRLDINEVDDILEKVESGEGLTPKQKAFHFKTKLRDTAILTLFLGTGIRISELVGLNLDDIDFYNSAFKVTRKGGNQEILYFNDEVSLAILEYIESRESFEDKALFCSLQNKRISIRSVENLVQKYAKIISPLKKITPHKLRSTFGTNLYNETNDIYVVAEMLGHKDINVTKKHYAAISEDIKRVASKKVKLHNEKDKN